MLSMTKKTPGRPGDRHMKKTYAMRLDEQLMEQVKLLAERNRRTSTMEVTIAIEKHLAEEGMWPPSQATDEN
jgi:predicted transcriptional regulator